MSVILKIQNLYAGYSDLQVLKGINMEIEEGTINILMGPNGAGKTTLLKSIFNLVDISDGKIYFNDKDITHFSTHKLLSYGISYVPQGKINFDTLTIEENLFIGSLNMKSKDEFFQSLNKIYTLFPALKEKKKEYAYNLSGGQQQQLAIARSLMQKPKLILFDEPSLGLSPKLVKQVFYTIKEIRDVFGITCIVVEHNLKSVLEIADYGFILTEGNISYQGTPEDIISSGEIKKVFTGE